MRRRKYRPPRDPADIEDHQRCAVGHSKRRLRERAHLRVPDQVVINHGLLISFGQSTLLGTGAAGRELHKIVARGHLLYAVFDKEIRRIVTYLNSVAEWRGRLSRVGREEEAKLPTTEKISVRPATALGAG
jgi:hypothetical protein